MGNGKRDRTDKTVECMVCGKLFPRGPIDLARHQTAVTLKHFVSDKYSNTYCHACSKCTCHFSKEEHLRTHRKHSSCGNRAKREELAAALAATAAAAATASDGTGGGDSKKDTTPSSSSSSSSFSSVSSSLSSAARDGDSVKRGPALTSTPSMNISTSSSGDKYKGASGKAANEKAVIGSSGSSERTCECMVCGKLFPRGPLDMSRHTNAVTLQHLFGDKKTSLLTHRCRICSLYFNSDENLQKHLTESSSGCGKQQSDAKKKKNDSQGERHWESKDSSPDASDPKAKGKVGRPPLKAKPSDVHRDSSSAASRERKDGQRPGVHAAVDAESLGQRDGGAGEKPSVTLEELIDSRNRESHKRSKTMYPQERKLFFSIISLLVDRSVVAFAGLGDEDESQGEEGGCDTNANDQDLSKAAGLGAEVLTVSVPTDAHIHVDIDGLGSHCRDGDDNTQKKVSIADDDDPGGIAAPALSSVSGPAALASADEEASCVYAAALPSRKRKMRVNESNYHLLIPPSKLAVAETLKKVLRFEC